MRSADDGLRPLSHRELRKLGFALDAIETGATAGGVPDTHWTHAASRTSGWIEHKATSGWAVTVRPHQVGWLTRYDACGGRGRLFVRCRGAGSARGRGDALVVLDGALAGALADDGLEPLVGRALGAWYGPPAEWDWRAVAALLTRD